MFIIPKNMNDKNIINSLVQEHRMKPHPEGGHYVEVFRNDNVTHIFSYLKNTKNRTGTE